MNRSKDIAQIQELTYTVSRAPRKQSRPLRAIALNDTGACAAIQIGCLRGPQRLPRTNSCTK